MAELKTVRIFEMRYEAEMAKGLLLEQGIESMISADDCGGQLMGLTSLRKGGVKLLIRGEDEEKAVEALQVLEADGRD
ncbi:MAG: DUF2007 domain-containing protein [Candidatus Sabulitectum sp.]|nr:DUF2007 domain-containing protein [Candidatus Sabulitectum sp.]